MELEVLMLAYGESDHIFRRKSNTAAAAKERETAWENMAARVNTEVWMDYSIDVTFNRKIVA